ncbi:methyltransferase [Sporanaerobium hydrogeniformans]|uniref:Methyltransferase n=1 Tax=Sporanaerobium hydrogeniformans TaxID=3072179 RepID=A0AC61D6Y8_9FIRM|nr:uroporphyrinogen decarboxylase family protein [Sporanaerobium hydrogeniformans]PHV69314.1 methyltransferase [Sporanaerobium hydrogeniformans]
MNAKARVQRALEHQAGPVPFDMGAFPTTGIHVSVLEKLRDYYGLEKKLITVLDPYQMLGYVDDDLREAIGIDTTILWNQYTMYGFKNENFKEWVTPWGQKVLVAEKFVTSEDKANVYIYAEGDKNYSPAAKMPKSGFFFDSIIRQREIDDDNLKAEDNLEEFGELSEEDIAYYKKMGEQLKDSPYYVGANLGGTAIGDIACVPGPMLKDPKGIRDVEEWYVSTAMRQDYLHEIFDKQVDIALKNLERIYKTCGEVIDIAYVCGNDFGTQNGPFCSTDTFRELYAPYYKRINSWIHHNTHWKTFKHTCGSIMPLIPDLIDAGFDVINPVQWTAKNMEPQRLKSEFGKDVVFWGAGINTQKTLPFGSPEEVRKEVLEICEIFSKDGGFVFNTIHNIQALTPTQNLVAMIEAVREFNGLR